MEAGMKTHHGGCHCGNVRYDVQMDLGEVMQCNCSICSKTGSLLAFTSDDRFELRSGSDDLTDYQFASKNIHHLFCEKCGVRSFARGKGSDGKPMVAINVRCLEGVDLEKLKVKAFDGASL
jgi:hypothetical protein